MDGAPESLNESNLLTTGIMASQSSGLHGKQITYNQCLESLQCDDGSAFEQNDQGPDLLLADNFPYCQCLFPFFSMSV